ncbi:hypothetical protein C4J83_3059 [Pseudomonas sp. LBUM920]|jgi:hypothetical protein|nr:hypothetical protein C4J83_3059 [Pseudomonas sp. LBUM920]
MPKRVIVNTCVKPQQTGARQGDDLPQLAWFAGINVTFAK